MKKLAIVVPCYNEEENIEHLINSISDMASFHKNIDVNPYLYEDGSTDSTFDLIEKHAKTSDVAFRVLKSDENKGYTFSLQYLYGLAFREEMDFILKIDADTDFDHDEISEKIIPYTNEGVDYVIGIRDFDFSHVDKNSSFGEKYNLLRRTLIMTVLKEKFDFDIDPASMGVNLLSRQMVWNLFCDGDFSNYKKRWGVDLMIALTLKNDGTQPLIINLENSNYDDRRRAIDKMNMQYNGYSETIAEKLKIDPINLDPLYWFNTETGEDTIDKHILDQHLAARENLQKVFK